MKKNLFVLYACRVVQNWFNAVRRNDGKIFTLKKNMSDDDVTTNTLKDKDVIIRGAYVC